ncbi:MAG: excisionase family DNA-binding protein [Clostridiales bacterium]|nr:excisionase family DNA-binding protein [Clostridiales bacterium]
MNNKEVPIWEKANLTIDEAALYTNIGRNKLRELTDDDRCPFVLWVGNKRLLKRKKMDEYLEKAFSI